MAEELVDAHLLGFVVLDYEQPLTAGSREILDAGERIRNALARRRLSHEGEGAASKPVLTVFVERDDLHRNMPGERILL